MKIFADKESFRKKRIEAGYTTRSLAKAVKKTESYLSRVENGRVSISPTLANEIMEKIKCFFSDIFFLQNAAAIALLLIA